MSRLGLIGGTILLFFCLLAFFAPFLTPYSPNNFSGQPLEIPSTRHLLGTDGSGQDIFSQLIYGTRVSLLIGLTVSLFSTLFGGVVGLLSGFYGKWIDRLLMRFLDIFLTIPHLPLMLLLAAYFPPALVTTIFVLILFSWPLEAKLVRSQVLSLKKREYLEAARLAGAKDYYLMYRYLIPELTPLIVSQLVLRSSWAVLAESGLAFLGLGDPSIKSWGMILKQAISYEAIYFTPNWQWWLLPPGICITLLIFAFTFLGYALEEKFNPTLKEGV